MNRYFRKSAIYVSVITLSFLVNSTGCSFFKNENVIRIGFIGSFTEGKYSDWGKNTRDGALLAVDEINKAGGINGKQVELVIKDDRHNPAYAEKLLDEFVKDGVRIIIGPVLSSVAIAIIPSAEKKGILLVSPSASTDELTGRDDLFFRVIVANAYPGSALADFMIIKRGLRSVCIIFDENNLSYSASWRDSFLKRFKKDGGAAKLLKGFKAGDDYEKICAEVLRYKPESILIICGVIDMAAICQNFKKLGSDIQIAGSGAAMSDELLINGGEAVEGLITVAQFDDSSNTPFERFKAAFKNDFGYAPLYSAVYGYDTANLIFMAVKEDGKTDCFSVKKNILRIRRFISPFGDFEMDSSGDAQRNIIIIEVRKGKFVKAE